MLQKMYQKLGAHLGLAKKSFLILVSGGNRNYPFGRQPGLQLQVELQRHSSILIRGWQAEVRPERRVGDQETEARLRPQLLRAQEVAEFQTSSVRRPRRLSQKLSGALRSRERSKRFCSIFDAGNKDIHHQAGRFRPVEKEFVPGSLWSHQKPELQRWGVKKSAILYAGYEARRLAAEARIETGKLVDIGQHEVVQQDQVLDRHRRSNELDISHRNNFDVVAQFFRSKVRLIDHVLYELVVEGQEGIRESLAKADDQEQRRRQQA